MELTKEQTELLDKMDADIGIDMAYELINGELPETIDDFTEAMQERIGEIEVIYYSNAMEYLAENDTSLRESMGLASDMGYEAKNINSELLATILKQQNASEKI